MIISQKIERIKNMDIITNSISAIAAKPVTGISLTCSAWIIHIFGLLTPYITFIILILGGVATVYSLIAQFRKAKHFKNLIDEDVEKKNRHYRQPKK